MTEEEEDLVDTLVTQFRLELESDRIGLWAVNWEVQRSPLAPDAVRSQRLTLAVVHRLLCEAGVVVGQFDAARVFEVWPVDPDTAVESIRLRWLRLGRPPDIGELAWLSAMD